MITLDGAKELRRLVLDKWRASTISDSISGYVRKFSCPDCGGEAYETFRIIIPEDQVHAWWGVEWTSNCGYVSDCLSSDDCSLVWYGGRSLIGVEENGVVVGLVDPSFAPPWRRYEASNMKTQTYARFGTLWQSLHASVDESRLLAAIQST